MNYRKILQKNKLCHPKQQQIGNLMIALIVSCLLLVLIEKLAFFKKTVVMVYYILKEYRLKEDRCKFKIDKINYYKLQSRRAYDDIKNKPSF